MERRRIRFDHLLGFAIGDRAVRRRVALRVVVRPAGGCRRRREVERDDDRMTGECVNGFEPFRRADDRKADAELFVEAFRLAGVPE